MNYQWHYDRLISTRKERIREESVYYENHHVIMKSMGGTDEESNIVFLTPREHFLAHWLLWRIHRNRQTAFAFNTFCEMFKGKNHSKRTLKISSRSYQEAREAYSLTQKEKMKGVLNSNRSKIVLQYDLNGNFIKEWPSAKEAYRQLDICHITSCCRGEREWAGGFIWKYKDSDLKKSKPYKKRDKKLSFEKQLNDAQLDKQRKRRSFATLDRKWYNDGSRDFFLKPFQVREGLVLGRLANRKNKIHG
jgi:hypothetical protein